MRTAAALAILIAPLAQAGFIPAYSNWTDMDDVGASVFLISGAPRRVGLTFESAHTGELASVSVALSMSGSISRTVGVEVWTLDDAGLPATVIAFGSTSISGTDVSSHQSFDLGFQVPDTIEAGQSYAVVLFRLSGPSFNWCVSTAPLEGNIVSRLSDGTWKALPSVDAGGMPTLRVNVVPAPGGLALLAVMAGVPRRRRA